MFLVAEGASADVVTDWNQVYLDTIRATDGPPCPISRAKAASRISRRRSREPVLRTLDVL